MSSQRKDDHIKLALVQEVKKNAFDHIILDSTDLPDFGINDVDLSTNFLGHKVDLPIYINAMTGGSKKGYEINQFLAKIASHFNIPIVTGSQSIALKDSQYEDSFKVIRENYKGIVLSNINANYDLSAAKKAVEMIDADGLTIHLNLIQELVMHEGDRDFSLWSKHIASITSNLDKPIMVKQVGMGLSLKTITKLKKLGVKHIDVAGSGGTSFLQIEATRSDKDYEFLNEFGIDTADILIALKDEQDLNIYASGGIRNPLDVIKSLVLNAKAVGLSKYFLKLYDLGYDKAIETINTFIEDLKKIMVILGARSILDLKNIEYKKI